MPGYGRRALATDLTAGAAIAVLLLPQAMAYALLAGLPPRVGFYAALAPAIAYAAAGTSRYLSIGPVALVSLLVADAVGRHGGDDPLGVALALAALVGLVLVAIGLLRLSFLMNFVSEPVLVGFTTAAAVLIAATQLEHLIGVDIPRGLPFHRQVAALAQAGRVDGLAFALGGSTVVLLLLASGPLVRFGSRWGLGERGERRLAALARAAPLVAVAAGVAAVLGFGLDRRFGLATVGEPGSAVPSLTLPPLDPEILVALLPSAVTIAVVAYILAVAIGTSLGGRRRERIDPGGEAIALGLANLGAAVTGGYPVGASVSRSAVAFEAAARSPLAAATGGAIAVAAAALAGRWVGAVPKAILAGIVLAAVVKMIDPRAILRVWRYNRADGLSLGITTVAVLALGIEMGIAIGAAAGLALYLFRTSQPRIVLEGRAAGSRALRDAEHSAVEPEEAPVLVLRVDQSLYFANIRYIEERVLREVAERPDVACLLLDMRAVNDVDVSALDMLERLADVLEDAGVDLCLAETKLPVAARLQAAGLAERLGSDCLFPVADRAIEELRARYRPATGSTPAGDAT